MATTRNYCKPAASLLFARPPLLPGSALDNGRLGFCCRCLRTRSLQGGVELSASRWCCASCWKNCTAGTRPQPKRLFKAA